MNEDSASEDAGTEVPISFPAGFRTALRAALAEQGYSIESWEADGVNIRASETGETQEHEAYYLGLSNLYRRMKAAERGEWPGMIHAFLDHILGTLNGPTIPDDMTSIADQLRPRLGKPFARDGRAYPWGIPLPGTGLEINLVIDFPNTMAYVTEEMLRKSRRSGEDLLDLALANLQAATPGDFFETVSDEVAIQVGHTGDGYDAARALFFEDIVPESPAGFFVAIPSRDELAIWPVTPDAIAKIPVIKLLAEDNFQNHAYPITDDVFWVWRGTWYHFDIQLDEKEVTVSPPDEFMEVLRELGAGVPDDAGEDPIA